MAGDQKRVVAVVGVEQLLGVDRSVRVLAAQKALVETRVVGLEERLGQVEERVAQDEVVQGALAEGKARQHGVRAALQEGDLLRVLSRGERVGGGEVVLDGLEGRGQRVGGDDTLDHRPPCRVPAAARSRVERRLAHPLVGSGCQLWTTIQQTFWGILSFGILHCDDGGVLMCSRTTWYWVGP